MAVTVIPLGAARKLNGSTRTYLFFEGAEGIKLGVKSAKSSKEARSDPMSETPTVKLTLIKGYRFNVEFDEKKLPKLIVDELPPIGEGAGPNPTRLLAVAVGHCLSSSLLYCLDKARIRVRALETLVKAHLNRNSEGRLRVSGIDVEVHLDVYEEDKNRVKRCLSLFETYCTVTQSVRNGVEVKVKFV